MTEFGLEPLAGGWSGETFLAEAAGERTVVRVYGEHSAHRGPTAPEVDAAVLALVRGLVPVPEVLEVRRADPEAGVPGLLVTAFVPGVRGDLLLAELPEEGRARVGDALGRLAGTLACMPTARVGPFLDGALRIGDFKEQADLVGLVTAHAPRLDGWSAGDLSALDALARHAASLLDAVPRHCLVHSDLNPKNVLLDPDTLEVAALLDWEYAHAGGPTTDLGNLLRFERTPSYVRAVLGGYRERVPRAEGGGDLLDRARAADLAALVTLAVRRAENPVAQRAHDLLLAAVRAGDLHATASVGPPPGAGVG